MRGGSPPSAYTAESLLWRRDEWRQPGPEERAQMMGFPAQCLQAVQGPAAVRRQRQKQYAWQRLPPTDDCGTFLLAARCLEYEGTATVV